MPALNPCATPLLSGIVRQRIGRPASCGRRATAVLEALSTTMMSADLSLQRADLLGKAFRRRIERDGDAADLRAGD
jgi:hypothetical protein